MAKARVLLIGDSIIDNGAYVSPGEPDVTQQLQALLPQHPVVKRALDGAVCADVLHSQLGDLEHNDRIILSVGGNDALQHIDLLEAATATTTKDVLVRLWTIRADFRRTYASLLDHLKGRPVLVLTVYNPCFDGHGMDTSYQQAAESAVSIFDDVIQQEAHHRSFDVLELRTLFSDRADYANPIEPSAVGGAKLAKAMSAWVTDQRNVNSLEGRETGAGVRAEATRGIPRRFGGGRGMRPAPPRPTAVATRRSRSC